MSKSKKYKFKVDSTLSNQRIDSALVKLLPQFSRGFLAEQIKTGQVKVNRQIIVATKKRVKDGEFIEASIALPSEEIVPQSIKLNIIYQDKDLVVINKPPGIVMHPAGALKSDTLANALKYKFKNFYLVHRLDKDTSGVVLVARNQKTKDYLSNLFAKRQIKKTYTALVKGKVSPKEACINLPIKRVPGGKFTAKSGGRLSESCYLVKKHLKQYSLVEVTPKTGRTHQIRVHFAAIGHPVVGDKLYGTKEDKLARQFLHALKIEFKDEAGKERSFSAPLPKDLTEFLNGCKK
ncbi:RluA family pseudouridine synthase [Patescibacteria group bacterium]|nr:RluA family pseudouridine synthase [Patescibacteria group bacterium]